MKTVCNLQNRHNTYIYLININLCKKTSDCKCQLPMKTHHNKRSPLFLEPSESGVRPPVSGSLVAVAGAEQPSPVWSLSPPAEAATGTSHIVASLLHPSW